MFYICKEVTIRFDNLNNRKDGKWHYGYLLHIGG